MHKRTEPFQDLHCQIPKALYEEFVLIHPAYGERTRVITRLLKYYVAQKRVKQPSGEASREAA